MAEGPKLILTHFALYVVHIGISKKDLYLRTEGVHIGISTQLKQLQLKHWNSPTEDSRQQHIKCFN